MWAAAAKGVIAAMGRMHIPIIRLLCSHQLHHTMMLIVWSVVSASVRLHLMRARRMPHRHLAGT